MPAVRYLSQHYRDNTGIEALAERLGWSPRHLTRRFKDAMGLSPVEYLTTTIFIPWTSSWILLLKAC
ncbi:AraC family transcriptional regulator [Paenibacillus sp. CAU 1782]